MQEEILIEFAKKWDVDKDVVYTIYIIVRDLNQKYGKVSKTLEKMGVGLSPRQIKYFYRRVVLTERYGAPQKIGVKNYVNCVLKKS